LRQQRGDAVLLGPAIGGGDRLAQRILFADGGAKSAKGGRVVMGADLWNGMRDPIRSAEGNLAYFDCDRRLGNWRMKGRYA
jgi:hypothetical protein